MAQELANIAIKLSANMADFENDMGRAARIAKKNARKIKRSIANEMQSVFKVVGGVAAATVGVIAKFGNFEQSMKKVGAVSGATAKELKLLSKTALELAASTRFNPSQATSALYSLSSAGQSVNEQIATLPNVLNLAEAASADLGTTTELVVSSLAQFNIEASDSQRVVDVLTASIANSSTNVERLQVGMRNAGSSASAFNQSFESTVASVSVLTTVFANGEKAGSGYSSALAKLAVDGSKLGLDVFDASGKMKPFLEILKDMESAGITGSEVINKFGKEAGVSLAKLLDTGSAALQRMEDKLTSNGQAAATASQQFDTLKGDYDQLISALDVFIIKMGETSSANSSARKLIQSFTETIQELSKHIDEIVDVSTLLVKSFVALKVARIAAGGVALLGLRLQVTGKVMEATAVRAATLKKALAFMGGPVGVLTLAAFGVNELNNRYAIFNSQTKETIDIVESVNKVLATKIDTSNIVSVENKYKSARKELEKLNKEVEKAIIADRIGLRHKRTPIKADSVRAEISALNEQIEFNEKLDTTIAGLHSTYKGFSSFIKKVHTKVVDENNKKLKLKIKIDEDSKKKIEEVNKKLEEQKKIYESIGDSYTSAISSLLTPLENVTASYENQKKAIEDWQNANLLNFEIWQKSNEMLERNKKQFDENKKALNETIDPYKQLLKSIQDEITAQTMNTEQLRRAHAIRLLMQDGIIKAGDNLDDYKDKIDEVTDALKKLDSTQGAFGNGTNSFSDLLKNASKDFSTFFDTIKDGFSNMGQSSQQFADGMESIGQFAESVMGMWDATSGQDDAGRLLDTISQVASTEVLGPVAQAIAQVANFVDQLTGGSLFGTSFEVQSSARNLSIGQGGASGGTVTRESRRRSLFRGTQTQETLGELEQSTLDALNELFENLQIAIQNSAAAVGGVAGDLIAGSFDQEFDADGNLVSEISTVLGQTFEEGFDEFAQRLTAENILAGVGSVFSEVRQLASQWINDAGDYLEGAQMLLRAGADITAGVGLFNTLSEVVPVIQDLTEAGETLSQTYERVHGSVMLLDDALEIIEQSFKMARVEYVTLAADITTAAGGLQEASNLWRSYFETFYSEQELFQQRLSSATDIRDSSLVGLGLDSNITNEAFRELFEQVLPTLSAEGIVEWLRAADAIGAVIDLEGELADQRQGLTDILNNINETNAAERLSDFALSMRAIQNNLDEQIATAMRLGATEKELTMIRKFADRQFQNAIREFEQLAQELSNNIYGTIADNLNLQLDGIGQQISLLEQQQSAAQAAAQAGVQAYEAQQTALEQVVAFAESLLTGQYSPLNPAEQLAIAQAQFDDALLLAQGGDIDALGSLQGLAQTLLGLGQTNFASGQANTDLFNSVYDALAALGVGIGQGAPSGTVGVSSELLALYDQQAQLNQQLADAQRAADEATSLLQQQRLLDMLRELSGAQEISIQELAERLGIPLDRLIEDLDVSLYELNQNLNKPLQIEPPDNSGNELIANTITTESEETQQEIRTLTDEVTG